MEKANDPLTGESFIKQRANQVFASRANQIKYNNLKAQEKRKSKASIDRVLDKNRSIMSNILNGQTEAIKSYDFLLGAGFNFACVTHHVKMDQKKWNCVYDYAYILKGDNQFKITQLK